MSQQIDDLVLDVQKKAEEIHCASAILAAELMLRDKIESEYDPILGNLRSEMWYCSKDSPRYEQLRKTVDELKADMKRKTAELRFNITWAKLKKRPESKEEPARMVPPHEPIRNKNGSYTIVLPEEAKNTITEGLGKNLSGSWYNQMTDCKLLLRKLTLHELYHVLDEIENKDKKTVKDKKAKEDEANDFADRMLDLRQTLRTNRPFI